MVRIDDGFVWVFVWNGFQYVVFGYDVRRGFQFYEYVIGIDIGCVYGNYLIGILVEDGVWNNRKLI